MTERTEHLAAKDKKYLWHPFTQMKQWAGEDPLIIERGEGATLFDTDGNAYIDGVSSLWCNIHGHRKAGIDEAVRDQLDRIAHSTMLGLSGPPAIELAERLVKLAPRPLSKVFYSDSGSEAMEIALKIAFQSRRQKGETGRATFLALDHAYHGDTIGTVSLGGIPLFHSVYGPLLFETLRAPAPYCYRCSLGLEPDKCSMACLGRMDELLQEHADEVIAVVMEPLVQGAGGIIVHPPGYLRGVRELCDRHGVLLVCDEVAVGFGRTGRMFACEHEDVAPLQHDGKWTNLRYDPHLLPESPGETVRFRTLPGLGLGHDAMVDPALCSRVVPGHAGGPLFPHEIEPGISHMSHVGSLPGSKDNDRGTLGPIGNLSISSGFQQLAIGREQCLADGIFDPTCIIDIQPGVVHDPLDRPDGGLRSCSPHLLISRLTVSQREEQPVGQGVDFGPGRAPSRWKGRDMNARSGILRFLHYFRSTLTHPAVPPYPLSHLLAKRRHCLTSDF